MALVFLLAALKAAASLRSRLKINVIPTESGSSSELMRRIPVHVNILIIVSPIVIGRCTGPIIGILAKRVVVPRVAQVTRSTGG